MNFDHFQPVGDQVSLFAMGQTDTSMGRKLTFYDQFTRAASHQLDAYRYQELRANTLLVLGGECFTVGSIRGQILRPFFGAWYDAAALDPVSSNSQFRQSATDRRVCADSIGARRFDIQHGPERLGPITVFTWKFLESPVKRPRPEC